jgi:hypothetical protein
LTASGPGSKLGSVDSQVRHALILGTALLAVLGMLVIPPVLRAVAGGPWPPPGPLGWPSDGWTLSAARTTPGQVYSYGIIDLPAFHGDTPAILDGVAPNTRVPDGLVVLGYRAIRNNEGIGGFIGVGEEFLPEGYVPHAVRGFAFARDSISEVVVGLKATRPGNFLIPGFTLNYHVGGAHFVAIYHQGAGLCAGETTPKDCDLSERMP